MFSAATGRRGQGAYAIAAVLVVLATFAAGHRAAHVLSVLGRPPAEREALSSLDRRVLPLILDARHVEGAEYATLRADLVRNFERFTTHPVYSLVHLVPALLVMVLVPLQFVRPVRRRYPQLHRWSGRVALLASAPIAVTAIYFGVVNPQARFEPPTIALITAGFVFAAARAWLAIRHRDVERHREWMIRTFAMMIVVASVRIIGLALLPVIRLSYGDTLVLSMWIGWAVTLGGAELWIRSTRPSRHVSRDFAYLIERSSPASP